MDPMAALIAMLDALREQDTETADEHFDNLKRWALRGGFIPQITTK